MKTKPRYILKRPRLFTYVLILTMAAGFSPLFGLSSEGYEDDGIPLEKWMTAPFETTFSESELVLEDWMTAPFGNTYSEPDLLVEDWMTTPFETSFFEPDLLVEDWMTAPY